jgi:uncharacterized membrane-anchored protein
MANVMTRPLTGREMLNKVPEVTLYFWIIKILCTTVGETASDYLTDNVGLGLTNTTYITAALLIATLVAQFRARRYIAPIYWLGIVLISVVGTQITDNLTDNHGVPLVNSTILFSLLLAAVFAVWFASERTLSIHTIFTTRREAFYWLTVLFTFALGTAAGDLAAERLALGYLLSAVMFAALIGLVALCHYRLGLGAVTAFWLAYILTRPLGASLGDFLSQPRASGGLGLGTTVTSLIFLTAIVAVVAYLTVTRRDATELAEVPADAEPGVARVLLVADGTVTASGLLDAIRSRIAHGPASFHILLPHWHASATALHVLAHHRDGGAIRADSSVAAHADAADAVHDAMQRDAFDEIILAAPHADTSHPLAQRIARLGLPLTTVGADVVVRPADA